MLASAAPGDLQQSQLLTDVGIVECWSVVRRYAWEGAGRCWRGRYQRGASRGVSPNSPGQCSCFPFAAWVPCARLLRPARLHPLHPHPLRYLYCKVGHRQTVHMLQYYYFSSLLTTVCLELARRLWGVGAALHGRGFVAPSMSIVDGLANKKHSCLGLLLSRMRACSRRRN